MHVRNDIKNVDYKDMEIKVFEEREWYVYRKGNELNYNEYWIDKNDLTDIRHLIFSDVSVFILLKFSYILNLLSL